MITVKNLHTKAEDKNILNGINLEVKAGEVHAIMGRTEVVNQLCRSHGWTPCI